MKLSEREDYSVLTQRNLYYDYCIDNELLTEEFINSKIDALLEGDFGNVTENEVKNNAMELDNKPDHPEFLIGRYMTDCGELEIEVNGNHVLVRLL